MRHNRRMNTDSSNRLLEEIEPTDYRIHPFWEAIGVGLAILVAATSTSYFIYLRALNAQEGEIRQGLLRTAHVAAANIDAATHQSYAEPAEESSERYQTALAPLVRMKESDPQIAYLYTAIKDSNGAIRFIYDVTPSPAKPCQADAEGNPIIKDDCEEDSSVALLEVYEDETNLAIQRAFESKKPTTSDKPYVDEFGEFISGYVPLKDAEGKFYAVLGMDIDIKDYNARLEPIKRATNRALVTSFFIAFITGSVVWFLRNFISVLNRRRLVLYRMLKRAAHRAYQDGARD
jgi:hypothetical protein